MKIAEMIAAFSTAREPLAELEKARAELESARAAVTAEQASMDGARQAALENDDAAALASLRLRRPMLIDEFDRLTLAIKQVEAKIVDERAAAKARRAVELREAHAEAVANYMQAAWAAVQKFDEIVAVRSVAIREGHANAVQAWQLPPCLPNGPAVLSHDLLTKFEANSTNMAQPRRVKATTTERKVVAPPPRVTTAQRAVRLDEMPTERHAPRRALLNETPGGGEIAISILRSGVSLPNRPLLTAGDVIAVTPSMAHDLLKSGAADYAVEAGPAKVLNIETETESAKESRA